MTDPREMTDEELRVARANWERERARLWVQVSTLTGNAYMVAYEDYMAAKAAADTVAAEARRRGVRRTRTPTTGANRRGASPDFRFEVSTVRTGITAVADGAVRYPDTARSALRDELRAAVSGLDVGADEVLRGTFAGALPPNSKTDVENRVLLNIGLPPGCLRRGFAFEHDPRPPRGWTCGYDYRAVAADDPFDLWHPGGALATWERVALDHGLTAPAVWWALRTAREATPAGPPKAVSATLLRTTITSSRPLSLNQIKAVADGAVAAAQWTRIVDATGLDCLTANLVRAGIHANRDVVAALLQDPAGAGAGHCKDGLVAKDGRIDPDDHLVVAGLVHVETGHRPDVQMTGAIYEAHQDSSARKVAHPAKRGKE